MEEIWNSRDGGFVNKLDACLNRVDGWGDSEFGNLKKRINEVQKKPEKLWRRTYMNLGPWQNARKRKKI